MTLVRDAHEETVSNKSVINITACFLVFMGFLWNNSIVKDIVLAC